MHPSGTIRRGARCAFPILIFALFASASVAQIKPPKFTRPMGSLCNVSRPQACPQIFRPVCGFTQRGIAQTYVNSCQACANGLVVRYDEGKCKGS
ncbi:MAG TPA: hypothetical protein VMD53_08690 [Rhizomicrobium sp.]|nr:hypothetical protein [Rhizomicrobium sp.]